MTEKRFIGSNGGLYVIEVEEAFDLINKLGSENKKLKKEKLDLSEELDYYKTKCASLETGLFQTDKENRQLKSTIKEVTELLSEEVDLFSDKATEHDINAYVELNKLDNKDAYYMATATKKAIKMLKELQK